MKSNFSFLTDRFPEHFKLALEAEKDMYTAPRTATFYSRLTLEQLIKWMYTFDSALVGTEPAKTTLEGLMYNSSFKTIINSTPGMLDMLTAIRKFGNEASHSKSEISLRYAHTSVNNLYEFCKWIYFTYVDSSVRLPLSLDTDLIPRTAEQQETSSTIKALESRLDEIKANAEKELKHKDNELKQLRAEVDRIKSANALKFVETFTINPTTEAETRRELIDVSLRELGWKLDNANCIEYEVRGMPNKTGVGYIDYVLWGDNGLPLAVVESKSTLHDPRKGQQQAKLYADCLEQEFGRRPLIFYSNGYNTWLWDDMLYPARKVAGFYSKDELEWTIRKRKKDSLQEIAIDKEIAGRPYQERAIKRVAETFENKHRKALLVMATGTGKTRTAISIVNILMKHRWARRVLFLADRNALVTQAKNNFIKLLPNLSCVDITQEKENIDIHRMVFSTYPTMMNKIDNERNDGMIVYSPAHFDLIIIDEAHRSVYQKYQAIFTYFDSLLIGLTATPKSDIDKNTYELFDLENHNPTDFYELDQAVTDGYLVPPRKMEVGTKFLREGIKYADLSDAEKEEYEEKFYNEEDDFLPEEISSSEINKFVFNAPTVDLVLNQLMHEGLKIEGGDKLGKSIIFAKNHKHAEFIEERFNILFPHLANGHFLRLIDNYATYAQSLIDDFSDPKKHPQIAVSVDMLDTGIDIPEVLNLVFFKIVRSSSKFWQMIGRGTRLCPNIFGDKKDKKEFLIFDYCGNFEFFGVNPDGFESKTTKSLSQRIMEVRTLIAYSLLNISEKSEEEENLLENLLNTLYQTVLNFNRNSFVVKDALLDVNIYSQKERWQNLSQSDVNEIINKLAPLTESVAGDEDARRFDIFMCDFILAIIEGNKTIDRYINKITTLGKLLLKKTNLPVVKTKKDLLTEITSSKFWERELTATNLEKIRTELRDLIRLIEKDKRKIVYTNLEDELVTTSISEVIPIYQASENYKQRVESYIRENENTIVIQKLKNNKPITTLELQQLENMLFDGKERGTKDDFVRNLGEQPLGWFIRSIVGLDVNAAKTAFGEFLNAGNLSANQIQFVDMIIDFISTNGVIDSSMLFDVPFTRFHTEGIAGIFDDQDTERIISILEEINQNAVA